MAEISPLRRRTIEDMTVRNLSPATQRSYLANFGAFNTLATASRGPLTTTAQEFLDGLEGYEKRGRANHGRGVNDRATTTIADRLAALHRLAGGSQGEPRLHHLPGRQALPDRPQARRPALDLRAHASRAAWASAPARAARSGCPRSTSSGASRTSSIPARRRTATTRSTCRSPATPPATSTSTTSTPAPTAGRSSSPPASTASRPSPSARASRRSGARPSSTGSPPRTAAT